MSVLVERCIRLIDLLQGNGSRFVIERNLEPCDMDEEKDVNS